MRAGPFKGPAGSRVFAFSTPGRLPCSQTVKPDTTFFTKLETNGGNGPPVPPLLPPIAGAPSAPGSVATPAADCTRVVEAQLAAEWAEVALLRTEVAALKSTAAAAEAAPAPAVAPAVDCSVAETQLAAERAEVASLRTEVAALKSTAAAAEVAEAVAAAGCTGLESDKYELATALAKSKKVVAELEETAFFSLRLLKASWVDLGLRDFTFTQLGAAPVSPSPPLPHTHTHAPSRVQRAHPSARHRLAAARSTVRSDDEMLGAAHR